VSSFRKVALSSSAERIRLSRASQRLRRPWSPAYEPDPVTDSLREGAGVQYRAAQCSQAGLQAIVGLWVMFDNSHDHRLPLLRGAFFKVRNIAGVTRT
jgi:hypothetical protein